MEWPGGELARWVRSATAAPIHSGGTQETNPTSKTMNLPVVEDQILIWRHDQSERFFEVDGLHRSSQLEGRWLEENPLPHQHGIQGIVITATEASKGRRGAIHRGSMNTSEFDMFVVGCAFGIRVQEGPPSYLIVGKSYFLRPRLRVYLGTSSSRCR